MKTLKTRSLDHFSEDRIQNPEFITYQGGGIWADILNAIMNWIKGEGGGRRDEGSTTSSDRSMGSGLSMSGLVQVARDAAINMGMDLTERKIHRNLGYVVKGPGRLNP